MMEHTVSEEPKYYFLSKISHDLRTPIGAIIGISKLMRKKSVMDDVQLEYMDMIDNCSNQLLTLVNDILDLSKCISGKMEVHNKPFNLKECIEQCYDINIIKANEKSLNISYMIDDDVPEHIISDDTKIKQILINLLNNAIKFTGNGSILTRVTINTDNLSEIEGSDVVKIRFSVYDTGIGIEEGKLSTIFDSFTQVENEYNRSYSGTGLGLSICKELTSLLGGTIEVKSEVDKGSEFYFDILTKRVNVNNLNNKHVIIVDDNSVNRMLYNNIFTELGMRTHTFSNGNKVIEYMKSTRSHINIAFIDIHMPKMDGVELSYKIRQINKKIIILSVSADITALRNSKTHLFDKNIYTPIDKTKLKKTCEQLLSGTQMSIKQYISRLPSTNKYCPPKYIRGQSWYYDEIYT